MVSLKQELWEEGLAEVRRYLGIGDSKERAASVRIEGGQEGRNTAPWCGRLPFMLLGPRLNAVSTHFSSSESQVLWPKGKYARDRKFSWRSWIGPWGIKQFDYNWMPLMLFKCLNVPGKVELWIQEGISILTAVSIICAFFTMAALAAALEVAVYLCLQIGSNFLACREPVLFIPRSLAVSVVSWT